MKLKKILYALPLATILLAVGSGCKKSYFNINQDINNPTDSTVSYDVILPAALHATGALVATQWGTIQNWMGYWARSGTYAPNVIEETYAITTGFGNGVWNNCYDNANDYQVIVNKAKVAGAGFYEGIARIMKAYDFMTLVDVYGNVPYREALKGSVNPTPAYDLGIDIYKDLLRQIDTAQELITASTDITNVDIETNDIVFGGDKDLWLKMGNTLKLKMLIHAYAVADINKAAEIAIIDANGAGYLTVGQNAEVNPGYKADKPAPFYDTYKRDVTGAQTANNVYYRANEWGIGYYAGDSDPREDRVYEAGSGGFIGVAYGLPPTTENASAVLAGIGPGLYKTPSSSQPILTAAESFFLQAEAVQRGFIATGDAQTLLETGIEESFAYLGVDDPATALADYLDYNAGFPDVDITAGPFPGAPAGFPSGGIFTILSQKWFALNGIDPLEVWTDYRRVPYTEVASNAGASNSHFLYAAGAGGSPGPTISVSPQNTATEIPVRYLYPQTEYNYNPANVGAEGTIDPVTSRIFWDLN